MRVAARLACLTLALLCLAPAALAQVPPVVKFPGGEAVPIGPGQFGVNPGGTIRWTVVFTNPAGSPGDLTFNFTDIVDGVTTCGMAQPGACPGSGQQTLLCPAAGDPNAVDPANGTVMTCDPATATLEIAGITLAPNTTDCVEFSTVVDPAATGFVSNQGCFDAVTPFGPQSGVTTPTTDMFPTCSATVGAEAMPGCSNVAVSTIQPPMFSLLKTGAFADADMDMELDIGEVVTWTVEMTNDEPDPQEGFAFDDIQDTQEFVRFVDDLAGACMFDAAREFEIECPSLSFEAGETKTLVFETMVTCGAASDDDTVAVCNQTQLCTDATMAQCILSDSDGMAPLEQTCLDFPFTSYTDSTKTATPNDVTGDGSFGTGDTVTYTITVVNSGRKDGEGVQVVDQLDPGCMVLPPLDDGGGTFDAGTNQITFDVGAVPAGESREVSFTVEFGDDTAPECCNQAEIRSTERDDCGLAGVPTDDPSTAAADDPTCVLFGPQPVLNVEKNVELITDANMNNMVDDNDEVLFTMTVRNDGMGPATNVVLDDLIQPCFDNFDPMSVMITGDGTNESTAAMLPATPARVRVTGIGGADGLLPGEQVVITFPVLFNDLGTGDCCNQANVTYAESSGTVVSDDPNTPAADDETCIAGVGVPVNLTVTKSAIEADPNGCFEPGEQVTFQILVEAAGGDATGVSIDDVIADPALVTFVSSPDGVFDGTDTVSWMPGTITDGTSVLLEWVGMIACDATDAQALSDTATATADNAADASDTWDGQVNAAVLTVAKTVTENDPDMNGTNPGETVTFDITVDNTGSCRATMVTLSDQLDEDIDWSTFAATPAPTMDDGMGGLTWDLGDIGPGAPQMITITATALDPATNTQGTPDGVISNTADAQGEHPLAADCPMTPGPSASDSSADVTIQGATPDELEVTKACAGDDPDGDGCLEPGENVTCTIMVTATAGNVNNVQLVDDVTDADDVVTIVSASDGGAIDLMDESVTWDLGTINDGDTVTRSWTGTIACDAPDGASFEDQADAVSTDGPTGSSGIVTTTVEAPRLVVSKTAEPSGTVDPGTTITFTITVTNMGTCASAESVVITDVVDADLDWTTLNITNGSDDGGMPPTITWDETTEPALASIAPGPPNAVTVTFEATALDPASNAQAGADGTVSNSATAEATGNPDPTACPGTDPISGSDDLTEPDGDISIGAPTGIFLVRSMDVIRPLTGGTGDCGLNTQPNTSTVLTTPCDMPFVDPSSPTATRIANPSMPLPEGAPPEEQDLSVGPVTLMDEALPDLETRMGLLVFYAFEGAGTLLLDKSGDDIVATMP